jgi:uncharacterized protein (TIGR00730 family)
MGRVAGICVFCGSSSGRDPVFAEAAGELGRAVAAGGHTLVYGGGHVGLMGIVADAALGAGGDVVGVMTEHLVAAEVAHRGLTRLETTTSMHARKARMAELADGVIVLPGGFGTFDETFEIITWNQLGLLSVPVVFLDVAAYFEPLFAMVDAAVDAGFTSAANAAIAQRATTVGGAIDAVLAPAAPFSPKWIG